MLRLIILVFLAVLCLKVLQANPEKRNFSNENDRSVNLVQNPAT